MQRKVKMEVFRNQPVFLMMLFWIIDNLVRICIFDVVQMSS